jgi:hypothetical protein
MFSWFSPKCPVNTWEKAWTETRMRWLADQFGIDRLLRAEVILPTEEHFPDAYNGTPADARQIMHRLCKYMKIDPQGMRLVVSADEKMPGAAGLYEQGRRTTIRVAQSQLANPQQLIATLTHELSHELLLGGGLLTRDVEDHEWVTDLLPAFLGIGIFAANSVLHEEYWTDGQLSWWRIGKQGYLPARIFGYAFALFAFVRDEREPEWARYLRLDAAAALRDGLRYLHKTDDSLFHPNSLTRPRANPTPGELADRLGSGTPAIRLTSLWDVRDQGVVAPEVVEAVTRCLEDPDPCIPGEAARTLACLGPAAAPAVPLLVCALYSSVQDTRAGAAQALGVLRPPAQSTVPELSALLADPVPEVVFQASEALRPYGRDAAPAIGRLLPALRQALITCETSTIENLTATLVDATPDPEQQIRDYFTEDDEELRAQALAALEEERELRNPIDSPAGS